MKKSDSIDKLTAALAKAQAVMEAAAKDSDNPFFHSKYADLASCWAAWRPAGPPNGLALMQFATASEERLDPPIQVQADGDRKAKTIHFIQRVSVETLLSFEDQWVSETLTVLVKDDSPQATILGETYCRRGGMCAVIGIAPEDDDGDSAANHGAETGERRSTKREPKPDCPKCEKNTFVYEDRQKGGFFCWKQKGGCGYNWLPEAERPTEEPFGKPPEKTPAAPAGANLGESIGAQTTEGTFMTYLSQADTPEKMNKLRTWFLAKSDGLSKPKVQSLLGLFYGTAIERTAEQDHERFEELAKLLGGDKWLMEPASWTQYVERIDKKRVTVGAA